METSLQYAITTDVRLASSSFNTFSATTNKTIIGSETLETEQLAQLLKLLLKEHPELQI